ncbi:hypothetical protein GIB67_021675, partial [Kingdonia uniflora]
MLETTKWVELQRKWSYALAFKSISPNVRESAILEGVTREWGKLIPHIPHISYEQDSRTFIANFQNPDDLRTIFEHKASGSSKTSFIRILVNLITNKPLVLLI